MEQEIWKDIPGYEGLYQASIFGNIRSLNYRKTKGIIHNLTQATNRYGYNYVCLSLNKKITVHRLIAITFISNKNNLPQVNHIDGNKQNNNISNLEWCTPSENIKHRFNYLLHKAPSGYNHYNKGKIGLLNKDSKIINQYDLMGNFIKQWIGLKDIERQTGICWTNISECCRNKRKTAGGFKWGYNS